MVRWFSSKRGQAAMEYLITYGWMMMVIAIVLGTLLYIGVFNTQKRTPNLCQFQMGFICTSFLATDQDTGALTMGLTNGLPHEIHLCDIVCDDTLSSPPIMSECATSGAVAILRTGEGQVVNFPDSTPCIDGGGYKTEAGDRYLGKLYLLYSVVGDTNHARMVSGELITTVQP
jgi:hypothetical protein